MSPSQPLVLRLVLAVGLGLLADAGDDLVPGTHRIGAVDAAGDSVEISVMVE